jgi:autotransporter-associated beta strand protein
MIARVNHALPIALLAWSAPFVLFAWAAQGAEVEWNQKGTVWEDPTNWSTGRVPSPDDIAVFPSPPQPVKNQPTVNGTVRVGGIVFENGPAAAESEAIKALADDHDKGEFPRPTIIWGPYTWIVNGAGKIVLGESGIRLRTPEGRAGSVIYPSVELAADQTWEIGPTPLPRSVASDQSDYHRRVYWKTQLMHNIFYGFGGAPELILFDPLSGRGALRKCGAGSIYYVNDHSPTFGGGTEIRDGLILWRPSQPGTYAFGAGPIAMDSGGLRFTGRNDAKDTTRLTNSIRILPHGGDIQSRYTKTTNESLDGDVELGGLLKMSFLDSGMKLSAPRITLSQRMSAAPGITDWECNPLPRLSMPIVDGPGDAGNPLILQFGHVLSLLSSENHYAGPTIVSVAVTVGRCSYGVVNVGPEARLGQGDLIVEPGGRVHLSAPGNLASNAQAHVKSNRRALGVLGVGYNGIPKIADDSAGVLAVDCEAFDAVSDLSRLGNGRMYLGSRDHGTYVGTALVPGKDSVYRLGGGSCAGNFGAGWGPAADLLASNDPSGRPSRASGGGLLTVEHSVLSGNADVVVGDMSVMGLGGVLLKSAQLFSGRLTVQGPASTASADGFVGVGSCLEGLAQSQTGQSPFGAPSGPVRLLNSTLKLTGVPGGQPVAKGELTFAGLSTISLDAKQDSPVGLTLAKLVREDRATLTVDTPHGWLGDGDRLIVTGWKAGQDLLPPYYVSKQGANFLACDAAGGKGVSRFASYVTDLTQATEKDVVKIGTGLLPGGGHTVRALAVDGLSSGTDHFRVASGGLILGGDLSADVDFGEAEGVIYVSSIRKNQAEWWNVRMDGKMSGTNGVTVSGPFATVNFTNSGNDFRGPITVNCATLCAVQDKEENGKFVAGSLGDLRNDIVLNGGNLCWTAKDAGRCIAPTRTIRLGPGGGILGGSLGHRGISPLFIHAKITGPGFFSQWTEAGSAVVITNGENDYSGGTWISMIDDQGMETTVSETGKLGTGPVFVGRDAALLLRGDKNIDPGARLSLAYTGIVDFESGHPVIGSLDGSGFVVLGVRDAPAEKIGSNALPAVVGCDTILTLGSDNTDATFYGTIQQRGEKAGDGIGAVTKTGTGTFTLHGGHTYTGTTTAEQGTLILKGSVAGDLAVERGGTFVLRVCEVMDSHQKHALILLGLRAQERAKRRLLHKL